MENKNIIELLAILFKYELSNKIKYSKDKLIIQLKNGTIVKISAV